MSAAKRERICCFLFWGRAVFEEEHKEWKGIKGGGIRGCVLLENVKKTKWVKQDSKDKRGKCPTVILNLCTCK